MKIPESVAINARGLHKHFDNVHALSEIGFDVFKGELFGFLGPNGAGKTTTINILTGLARPDSGRVSIGGIDCSTNHRAAQHLIGVVPDESNLYPELSGFENLTFCASLYGLKKKERESRAHELLTEFGLLEAAERKFAGYSKGMKRKLTIAAGIIHHPDILFLDEPTTGIDVASARQLRNLISELHSSGTTIFLTTHYIEEAERLCDRIAFIVSGQIVKIDRVENLLQTVQGKHIVHISIGSDGADIEEKLISAFGSHRFSFIDKANIHIESEESIPVGSIVRFLEEQGVEVTEAKKIKPSLEEVFVRITGIEADAMRKDRAGGGK